MGYKSPLRGPEYYQHTGPPETNPYPVTLHPKVGQQPSAADVEQQKVLQTIAEARGAATPRRANFEGGVTAGRPDGLEHHKIRMTQPPPKRVAEMKGVKGAVTRAIYKIPSTQEFRAYREARRGK